MSTTKVLAWTRRGREPWTQVSTEPGDPRTMGPMVDALNARGTGLQYGLFTVGHNPNG